MKINNEEVTIIPNSRSIYLTGYTEGKGGYNTIHGYNQLPVLAWIIAPATDETQDLVVTPVIHTGKLPEKYHLNDFERDVAMNPHSQEDW